MAMIEQVALVLTVAQANYRDDLVLVEARYIIFQNLIIVGAMIEHQNDPVTH